MEYGKWLTPELNAKPCMVRKRNRFGRYSQPKQGWELLDYLIYCDEDNIVWVASPGYVWDGSSYPSDESRFGRFLGRLVGKRSKEALLAASAHHDQMLIKSPDMFMYKLDNNLNNWKLAIENNSLSDFLINQPMVHLNISYRRGARLYKHMILDWPDRDESVKFRKALKQYIGLIIFQPWYSLFTGDIVWEKVEYDK